MDEGRTDQQIGYILRSYPRLSQTFILNEILGLERLGAGLRIFALSPSGEELVQPRARQVKARVTYLDGRARGRYGASAHARTLVAQPQRYLAALHYTAAHPELARGYAAGTRWQAFNQAVALADAIRQENQTIGRSISRLHAHFAHDPALVALLAHRLTGLPYSFTAHARDLYQVPDAALMERVRTARAVITCCQANLDTLREVVPPAYHSKLHLVHHGVDLEAFGTEAGQNLDSQVPLILSAGRLIQKKGFPDLISALGDLNRLGLTFVCHIYGEGPLRPALEEQIHRESLGEVVTIKGAYTQDQLAAALHQASLFALTPAVTPDGDRDGLPNVLVEAMACGLPVVSTCISGIPDLVQDERTGLLVPPGDVPGISRSIRILLDDANRGRSMGLAARKVVSEHFDQAAAAARLAGIFEMGTG